MGGRAAGRRRAASTANMAFRSMAPSPASPERGSLDESRDNHVGSRLYEYRAGLQIAASFLESTASPTSSAFLFRPSQPAGYVICLVSNNRPLNKVNFLGEGGGTPVGNRGDGDGGIAGNGCQIRGELINSQVPGYRTGQALHVRMWYPLMDDSAG